jgi:hypothetical protein
LLEGKGGEINKLLGTIEERDQTLEEKEQYLQKILRVLVTREYEFRLILDEVDKEFRKIMEEKEKISKDNIALESVKTILEKQVEKLNIRNEYLTTKVLENMSGGASVKNDSKITSPAENVSDDDDGGASDDDNDEDENGSINVEEVIRNLGIDKIPGIWPQVHQC